MIVIQDNYTKRFKCERKSFDENQKRLDGIVIGTVGSGGIDHILQQDMELFYL